MDFQIPNTKIIILEGVPGAGKNTIQTQIKEVLSDKLIYEFDEQEVLFSWKHGWLQNIDEMRLTFYENFLSYCEDITTQNPNSVFVVNRFHISYKIFTKLNDQKSSDRYTAILDRLKKLSAFVVVPILPEHHIEQRAKHVERVDPIWQNHLNKRLEQRGFSTLQDMYMAEQIKIQDIIKEQEINYVFTHVVV